MKTYLIMRPDYMHLIQKADVIRDLGNAKLVVLTEKENGYIQDFINYMRFYISKRRVKNLEKMMQKIIHRGVQKTRTNFVISGAPMYACLKYGEKKLERISTEHIFDTLSEFGSVECVSLWGENLYTVRFTDDRDAQYTAKQLNKMVMGGSVIRTYYVKADAEKIPETPVPTTVVESEQKSDSFVEEFDFSTTPSQRTMITYGFFIYSLILMGILFYQL